MKDTRPDQSIIAQIPRGEGLPPRGSEPAQPDVDALVNGLIAHLAHPDTRWLVPLLRAAWKRFRQSTLGLVSGLALGGGSVLAWLSPTGAEEAPTKTSQETPGSGPLPEASDVLPLTECDVETLDACAACRADSRLAIEACSTFAEACGVSPDELPKPPAPPSEYERPQHRRKTLAP